MFSRHHSEVPHDPHPLFPVCSQVVLGVVYNPFTKELYQAVKDGGAFLNGRRLEASRTTLMEEAMVVSGIWKRGDVAGVGSNRCQTV